MARRLPPKPDSPLFSGRFLVVLSIGILIAGAAMEFLISMPWQFVPVAAATILLLVTIGAMVWRRLWPPN